MDASEEPPFDAGPDASADADAAAPLLSESDFVAMLATAYCASIEPCCAQGLAGCVDSLTQQLTQLVASAEAGGQVFVPERAAECVAAVEGLPRVECTTWFASTQLALGACSGALDGTVAPGEECAEVSECERGTKNGTTQGGFVGCGSFDGMGPTRCRAFEPTTEVGAACQVGFAGSEPRVNVCAGGLACTDGTCEVPPPCDASHPTGACAEGFVCVAGVCEPEGQDGADCSAVPCARGYDCNGAQQCEARPPVPWILSLGNSSPDYQCPN
jgi:hypothetical protein